MANNSGSSGLLGVIIGAFLIVAVGAGLLFMTGNLGNNTTISVQAPKVIPTK